MIFPGSLGQTKHLMAGSFGSCRPALEFQILSLSPHPEHGHYLESKVGKTNCPKSFQWVEEAIMLPTLRFQASLNPETPARVPES